MLRKKTEILQVKEGTIPEEMKKACRWVVWAAVAKTRNDGTSYLTKEPRCGGDPGRKASSTNPATWCDFDTAINAYRRGAADGIGFVLGDGWAGIDIDDAIDPSTGYPTPRASEVASLIHGYSELSVSGTGIHCIVHGEVPEGRKVGGVEIYAAGRYFTVSGHFLPLGPLTIEPRQDQIDALIRQLDVERARADRRKRENAMEALLDGDAPPPPASDQEIIERAHQICRGFPKLWEGDSSTYDCDESRADLAMAAHLVFMCGPGQQRLVRRLMLQSGLRRDKWADNRSYLDRTISRAYDGREERDFYQWGMSAEAIAAMGAFGAEAPIDDAGGSGRLDLTVETTLDDIGYARRLAHEAHGRIRYVHSWGKWIHWDGRRWALDDGAAAIREAQHLRDCLWKEFAELPHAKKTEQALKFIRSCGQAKRLRDIVSLLRSQATLRIGHEQLDRNQYLFNARNGTIDLRTAEFRPHAPEDFLTQLAAVDYDPAAKAEPWIQFVQQAMDDDPELVRFLQASAGLVLSGDTSPQFLWCHYGRGSNGKSTFLGSLANMLGDYAIAAPENFLMMRQGAGHPTELAMLYGKRLVTAIECEGGRRMRESFVKLITGGDRIAARRMCEDFWDMYPTWHVHVSFNDPPTITGTDDGIRRRLRIVPWNANFQGAKRDTSLKARLESEEFRPGILNWCLAGFSDWLANGLPESKAISDVTEDYVATQDVFGTFITERCELSGGVYFDSLLEVFHEWLLARGENPRFWSAKRVGQCLKNRGIKSLRSTSGDDRGRTWYFGISLTAIR